MLWNTPESFHSACFIYSHIKTTEAEPSADEHIYIQLFKIKAERSVLLWKVKVTAIGRLRPTGSSWCWRRGGLVSRVVVQEIGEMKCDRLIWCRTKTWKRRSESQDRKLPWSRAASVTFNVMIKPDDVRSSDCVRVTGTSGFHLSEMWLVDFQWDANLSSDFEARVSGVPDRWDGETEACPVCSANHSSVTTAVKAGCSPCSLEIMTVVLKFLCLLFCMALPAVTSSAYSKCCCPSLHYHTQHLLIVGFLFITEVLTLAYERSCSSIPLWCSSALYSLAGP